MVIWRGILVATRRPTYLERRGVSVLSTIIIAVLSCGGKRPQEEELLGSDMTSGVLGVPVHRGGPFTSQRRRNIRGPRIGREMNTARHVKSKRKNTQTDLAGSVKNPKLDLDSALFKRKNNIPSDYVRHAKRVLEAKSAMKTRSTS